MTITSKNYIVAHVLTFDKGELVGGYIEDCDIFTDCYGHVLGSSDINHTPILPKHLASLACVLDLVYGDYISPVAAQATPDPVVVLPEPVKVDLPVAVPVAIVVAPEVWGAATATDIAKDVIAVVPAAPVAPVVPATPVVAVVAVVPATPVVDVTPVVSVVAETPVALEPLVAPVPTPVVPSDTIVLPTATEASPAVLAPVEISKDVVSTPEPTFVVPAQSVPEDAKPETTATANPSPDPKAPAIATSPDLVTDSSQEHTGGVPSIDAGILSPVVTATVEPAKVDEAKPLVIDALNSSDNEVALKAFL